MVSEKVQKEIDEARSVYKFLTFLVMQNGDVKCGIIQNETQRIIMFYDIDKVPEDAKERFLKHADEWWWNSNLSMPIDSFIGSDFDEFRDVLTGHPKKSLAVDPIGPTFSLAKQYVTRIKKRKINLLSRKA